MIPARYTQGFIDRPSVIQSPSEHGVIKPERLRPLHDSHSLAVMLHEAAYSCVVSLLASRSPFNVSRFVVSVVMLSFKRVFRRWAQPHIGYEICERHPALAHSNPTPSVVFVSSGCRPKASILHPHPDSKFWSLLISDCAAIFSFHTRHAMDSTRLMPSGATISTFASAKYAGRDIANLPAIASASDARTWALFSRIGYHRPVTEGRSDWWKFARRMRSCHPSILSWGAA